MQTVPIHCPAILPGSISLTDFLAAYLPPIPERSILAVTSKIIALCEGAYVKADKVAKPELVKRESSHYLDPSASKYGITLTIKRNLLIPAAGIDESNSNGHFVLWPRNPQESANTIRTFLKDHFGLREVGVIVTDSTTAPLRYGTRGVGIAYSGFQPLHDYRGEADIFGLPMRVTQANHLDALAATAVLVMGEGNEQNPLALITNVPFLAFQDRNPSDEELKALHIHLEDDLYAPLLTSVAWLEGDEEA